MQNKVNSELDARRFPEIFHSLTDTERQELCSDIIAQTGVSRMAVNLWGRGKRTPQLLSTKRTIVNSVKKVLGLKVSTMTLFD